MDSTYGVAPSFVDPPQFKVTNELPYPPAAFRRPAHWAQLHAGIQFIVPVWERNALIWQSRGVSIRDIATGNRVEAAEVRAAIARVCRTLATWEREQDPSATRYALREPAALWPDGARENEPRVRGETGSNAHSPDRSRGSGAVPPWRRSGHRAGHMEAR